MILKITVLKDMGNSRTAFSFWFEIIGHMSLASSLQGLRILTAKLLYLEEDFVVGIPVEGANGPVLVVADDLGAVQEEDRDTSCTGKDPGGADGDGRVQLGPERNALHRVNYSLAK